jgi:hypothetical protein
MELSRTIPKGADLGGKDPDHVVELCNEVGNLKSYTQLLDLQFFKTNNFD